MFNIQAKAIGFFISCFPMNSVTSDLSSGIPLQLPTDKNTIVKHKELLERLNEGGSPSLFGSDAEGADHALNVDIPKNKKSSKTYQGNFQAQFRAMIGKNWSLQSKQKGTNICQVLLLISNP